MEISCKFKKRKFMPKWREVYLRILSFFIIYFIFFIYSWKLNQICSLNLMFFTQKYFQTLLCIPSDFFRMSFVFCIELYYSLKRDDLASKPIFLYFTFVVFQILEINLKISLIIPRQVRKTILSRLTCLNSYIHSFK